MKYALAAVGFTSITAQVVLMREFLATFYGNELLIGFVLSTWLAWTGIGAWSITKFRSFGRIGVAGFSGWLIIYGLLAGIQITIIRLVRTILGIPPGAYVEFAYVVGAITIILFPLCVSGGALFTLGARLLAENGGTTGQAYAYESIGAMIGGLLFSFILIYIFNPYQIAGFIALINSGFAAYVVLSGQTSGDAFRPGPALYITAGIILLVIAVLAGSNINFQTLKWQYENLMFAVDSPYGRLAVQANNGQRVFYQNGLLTFETQGVFSEEVIHLPMLVHPDPKNVLLIGGGVAGDVKEILKHPVHEITYVEFDPYLIKVANMYIPEDDINVLFDPKVNLVFTDGRLFINNTAEKIKSGEQKPFDVVILDLPEPSTGSLNRFYTQEFYQEIEATLNKDGILEIGIPSAENYLSPELIRRNGSIYKTLVLIFPEIITTPGEHNFLLASHARVEIDPVILRQRYEERHINTKWVTPEYLEYLLDKERLDWMRDEFTGQEDLRANHDLTPISYYYDLSFWISRFYPHLRGIFEKSSRASILWILLPLGVIVVATKWQRKWAVPIAIGGIGLSQMLLQIVILFAFQVFYGYLYAEISLLISSFMAGLASGAFIGTKMINLTKANQDGGENNRKLIGVQLGIIVYSGALPLLLKEGIPLPTLTFPLLALLGGCLAGIAFPLAVSLVQDRQVEIAGKLYSADLLGGCAGALLGSIFLIPLLGIPQTCLVVVLVCVAGVVILL